MISGASHHPAPGLWHVTVVYVSFTGQVVPLYIERTGVSIPTEPCVHHRVGVIVAYLPVGIGIGAHAVLETILDGEGETLHKVQVERGGQLMAQILQ